MFASWDGQIASTYVFPHSSAHCHHDRLQRLSLGSYRPSCFLTHPSPRTRSSRMPLPTEVRSECVFRMNPRKMFVQSSDGCIWSPAALHSFAPSRTTTALRPFLGWSRPDFGRSVLAVRPCCKRLPPRERFQSRRLFQPLQSNDRNG